MNFYEIDVSSLSIDFLNFGLGMSSKNIASGLFGLVTFFTAMVAIIMFWHWNKYAMRKEGVFVIEAVYLLGSAVFITSAFTFLSKL